MAKTISRTSRWVNRNYEKEYAVIGVVPGGGGSSGVGGYTKSESHALFVDIDGDTMTGDLTVPNLSASGNIIVSGTVDGRDVAADGGWLDTLYTTIGLSALTAGEVNQLENIGIVTISNVQWGYLGALDQPLTQASAVTFATVNTGHGDNELYAMNQDVETTDSVTFSALAITNAATIGTDIGSPVYSSGFAGSGWQVDDSEDRLTIDNLTIRKQLRVYELLVEQVRANRGSLVISPGNAKIASVVGTTATVDTGDDDRFPISLVTGDILRCQRFSGNLTTLTSKYYLALVDIVTGNDFTFTIMDGTDTIEAGDEVVVFGNGSNAARQGLIYITSSDDNAPYIDILDGVNSDVLTDKTKVRLGKLTGITDADVGGALSGYGLYSDNVYLKGTIVASLGEIGSWTIEDKRISSVGNDRRIVLSTERIISTTGYSRGLTVHNDAAAAPIGTTKMVTLGQIRVKDSLNFAADEELGFEIVKRTGTSTYKHLVRFGDTEALIGGWIIDSDAIYTGTKDASGFSTTGITLSSAGSIHTPFFYVDATEAQFRTKASGARFVIEDDTIQMHNATTKLFEVLASTDGGKLGSLSSGSYIYTRGAHSGGDHVESYYSPAGIKSYKGATAGTTPSDIMYWDEEKVTIGSDFYGINVQVQANTFLNGGVRIKVTTTAVSGTYTALDSDYFILMTNTSTSKATTLPTAPSAGTTYIVSMDTHVGYVSSSSTIYWDGGSGVAMDVGAGETVMFVYASGWRALTKFS